VPGEFGEYARLESVFWVGAAIKVLRKKLLALGMLDEVGKHNVEVFLRHYAIAIPPNRIPREIVDDGVLVFRTPAGVVTGPGAQCTAHDWRGLARRNGVLIECRLGQIPAHLGQILETEFLGTIGAVPHTTLSHSNSSQQAAYCQKTCGDIWIPAAARLAV